MEFLQQVMSFEQACLSIFIYFFFFCLGLLGAFSFWETHTKKVWKFITIMVGIAAGCLGVFLIHSLLISLSRIPSIEKTLTRPYSITTHTTSEITILFKTPVDVKKISVHTFPEYDVTVEKPTYLDRYFPYGRRITIIPKTTIPSDQVVMVYVSRIQGPLFQGYGGEQLLEIPIPEQKILTVDPPDGSTSLPPLQNFLVTIDHPTNAESEWTAISDPPQIMTVKQLNEKTLQIIPLSPMKQATMYTLRIYQAPMVVSLMNGEIISRGEKKEKKKIQFTTASPGFISSFEPQGNEIHPEKEGHITFDEAMDTASVEKSFVITPSTSVSFQWDKEQKNLSFFHPPFERGTTYSVKLKNDVQTKTGKIQKEDVQFTFSTAGALQITETIPPQLQQETSTIQPIQITFNQPLPKNMDQFVSISPTVSADIFVHEYSLEIVPKTALSFDSSYTITIRNGVSSPYGLPLINDYVLSFHTSPPETILPVIYYKQQLPFTCNIAAARMLLAYRGIFIDENNIINAVGNGGKRGSGNPHLGYIDDYGTYWEAISRGVSQFRPNRLILNGSLSDIITEIENGNPVMIWGQNGWSDPHDISWKTPDGITITAVNGMHSSVVRGFKGPKEHPTHMYLNDPWRGQYSIDVAEFLRRWGYFSIGMVVE